MCLGGGTVTPDINKPDYAVDQIDKNVTVTTKGAKTSDATKAEKAAAGDGPVPVTASGIRMQGGK